MPIVTQVDLTEGKQVTYKLVIKDAAGNLAQVEGIPTHTIDNAAMVDLFVDADGLGGKLSYLGGPGSATLTVEADADLGAGVQLITATLAITVAGPLAKTIEFDVGPLEDVPTP